MNLDFLSDMLFPPACLGCSQPLSSGVLCAQCQDNIEIYKTLFCGSCAARLPDLKKICHKDTQYILGTASRYDDMPVQKLIHTLKFYGVRDAAVPLSDILIKYIARMELDLQGFTVIPIPLSIKRRRGRGFNQSALIAGYVAKYFSLPFEEHILTRITHNKPQSETNDLAERKENIHGCFSVPDPQLLAGKKILLIDDVTTSGTTFLEAARVLKASGAKKIIALAVAQA